MSETLPIPTQLQHLIEKRSGEENRKRQRRTATGDPKLPSEPQTAQETPLADNVAGDRRGKERRQSIRRQADQ
ncbi:MAG: hypothetical protein MK161_05450 [Pirellulales bacterium]|jgi:hypothetical protein|nr:hypothetical protein [Pirellulales bacterium]